MTITIFKLIGGIGLFLMGMVLLTDGLKAFAGNSIRHALMRFTGTPIKAFFSGTLATLIIQSSSATTVTVIGFVSAGLLTFPQTVGIVIGASLGTTGTGWIVSVLGLKISLGFYALPLVGIGAFLRLLAHGRWQSLGLGLAGFGLIFIGIETLQEGMQGLSALFDFTRLPEQGFLGHMIVVILGIIMTLILQSSSAAVATTMTALHTNTINFEQASSLVIGAAIGTTVIGALAAIGGSTPARRTAFAHILFNSATGLIAFLLLPLFLWTINWAQEHLSLEKGAMSLAAFHTIFIAFGAALFLPFVHHFTRWIERILPEKGPAATRHFDDSLLSVPTVALEATRRSLTQTTRQLFGLFHAELSAKTTALETQYLPLYAALESIQAYFSKIPLTAEHQPVSQLRVAQIHAIDHLVRLYQSRDSLNEEMLLSMENERLEPALQLTRKLLDTAQKGLADPSGNGWIKDIERLSHELAELRKNERPLILNDLASGKLAAVRGLGALDTMRWLDRIGYHAWRISYYLICISETQQTLAESADQREGP